MIRAMTLADLPAAEALEQRCFSSVWNEAQLRYELEENEFSHALVLEEDGVLIGTMIYWIVFETCQLCRIAVSPQQRRKGYGRALLRRLMEDAAAAGCEFITLEVRTSNQAAIAMYEAMGFVRGGCRKNYYQDNGEDAYVYARAPGVIE